MLHHSLKHILYFFGVIFLGFSCKPDKPEAKPVREVVDYSGKAREALNYCRAHQLSTSFFHSDRPVGPFRIQAVLYLGFFPGLHYRFLPGQPWLRAKLVGH